MKTINLRGISEILCEKELKNVTGGLDARMILLDDNDIAPQADGLSPKQEACKNKPAGTPCSFKDNRGVTWYGKCVQILWSPMHCSNLN